MTPNALNHSDLRFPVGDVGLEPTNPPRCERGEDRVMPAQTLSTMVHRSHFGIRAGGVRDKLVIGAVVAALGVVGYAGSAHAWDCSLPENNGVAECPYIPSTTTTPTTGAAPTTTVPSATVPPVTTVPETPVTTAPATTTPTGDDVHELNTKPDAVLIIPDDRTPAGVTMTESATGLRHYTPAAAPTPRHEGSERAAPAELPHTGSNLNIAAGGFAVWLTGVGLVIISRRRPVTA